MEQVFGVNFEPEGLPFDRALRPTVGGPASGTLFDWMHCLVSNGVATWEVHGFVKALRLVGVGCAQLDDDTSLYTLPKRLSKLPRDFFQQRWSEDSFRAFASEMLTLLPLPLKRQRIR
jgi:hypothetical protein